VDEGQRVALEGVDRRLIGTTPKLVCEGAWKLFGPDAEGFLAARGGTATLDDIRTAGLVPAVRNVDLTVRVGESFVVMGLSGCGKSTLVRCLSRITELTAGRVQLDGRDLGGLSRDELVNVRRHTMGMVFQHFALLPHLTVLENVAFPLRIQGRPAAERDARARELVELVGLSGRELHFPRQLSGGQQQRVGIARSLAVNPEVWFLDEPFSALDPLIRSEMQDEFLRLRTMFSTTIVFITHDLDEAVRLATRIAIMRDGEIIQTDTPEGLILRPANSYVEEFTRRIPRAKVLTAGSVMRPGTGPVDGAGVVVRADARVCDVAAAVLAAPGPVRVADAAGSVVGLLDRDTVISVLADAPSR
jgi:glycine betaine/proline transport system ATP-binding protein